MAAWTGRAAVQLGETQLVAGVRAQRIAAVSCSATSCASSGSRPRDRQISASSASSARGCSSRACALDAQVGLARCRAATPPTRTPPPPSTCAPATSPAIPAVRTAAEAGAAARDADDQARRWTRRRRWRRAPPPAANPTGWTGAARRAWWRCGGGLPGWQWVGHRPLSLPPLASPRMRRLWPDPGEVDDLDALVATEERPAPPDRPWLLVNMVASLDGAITIDERSGRPRRTRRPSDVLRPPSRRRRDPGGGRHRPRRRATARHERPSAIQAVRRERQQAEVPRLAIVTRSLDLDLPSPLFSDPSHRPYVITHEAAPQERVVALADVAEVLTLGTDEVDLVAALADAARRRGSRRHLRGRALPERRPHRRTTSSTSGPSRSHPCSSPATKVAAAVARVSDPRPFELARLLEADGELLGRWVRSR